MTAVAIIFFFFRFCDADVVPSLFFPHHRRLRTSAAYGRVLWAAMDASEATNTTGTGAFGNAHAVVAAPTTTAMDALADVASAAGLAATDVAVVPTLPAVVKTAEAPAASSPAVTTSAKPKRKAKKATAEGATTTTDVAVNGVVEEKAAKSGAEKSPRPSKRRMTELETVRTQLGRCARDATNPSLTCPSPARAGVWPYQECAFLREQLKRARIKVADLRRQRTYAPPPPGASTCIAVLARQCQALVAAMPALTHAHPQTDARVRTDTITPQAPSGSTGR